MQKFQKIVFWFAAAFLVLPLVYTPSTMFPWLFGKTIFFQMGVEILTLIFLFLLWKGKALPVKKMVLLDVAVYVFLGLLLLTSVVGQDFLTSFWPTQMRCLGVFTWLHFGLFYFFITQFVDTPKKWNQLMTVSVAVALVIAFTGLLQNVLPAAWSGRSGTQSRLAGILGNPAFFGSYLLVHVGISLYLFTEEVRKRKFWFVAAALVFTLCALLSGARGVALGLVVGLCTFGAAFVVLRKNHGSLLRRSIPVFVGLVVLVGVVLLVLFTDIKNVLPASLQRLFQFSVTTGTGDTRLMAWDIAWKAFLQKPLSGWGWENFDIVFNKLYNPQFLKYGFTETVWDKPHNAILEMLAAMGVWGLSYVAVGVVSLWGAAKVAVVSTSAKNKMGMIILFSTLVAYGVQNLFLFDMVNVLIPLFLILGFISFSVRKNSPHAGEPGKEFYSLILILVGTVLMAFGLWSNVNMFRSSVLLNKTLGATDGVLYDQLVTKTLQTSTPLKRESAVLIAEQWTKLEKANQLGTENSKQWQNSAILTAETLKNEFAIKKNNPLLALWSGQVYMILGQMVDAKYFTEAQVVLSSAETLAPRKQEVFFLKNRLALLQKDFPKAIEAGTQAVALEPEIGISHWFLGLAYVADNEVAKGLEEIEIAQQKGYVFTQNERLYVIDLYLEVKQYDQVIAAYKELVDADPGNVNWYIKLASAYALAGKKAEAIDVVNTVVRLSPSMKEEADKFIRQYNLQ